MQPKPVLIVARPAEGGIRSHILQLIAQLDRTRFRVGLAAPAGFNASLPQELPPCEMFDIPIAAKPSVLDPVAAIAVARLARQGFTLVHAHGIRAGFVSAIASRITPFSLITTYHNLPPESRLSKFAVDTISSRASESIAVSHAIASMLGRANTIVIPNGIELECVRPADRDQARTTLHMSPDTIAVACVARLVPDKGVDVLIRAARLLPHIQFLIAGSGNLRGRLESIAPANVRFLGYMPDPAEVYAAADIVAIPSRREGQGIVALEAMAAVRPIVASRVGGLPEMIEDEVTGLLTPREDAAALAHAIQRLAEDGKLRNRLASAGHKWVLANGRTEQRVLEIEAVYDVVTGG